MFKYRVMYRPKYKYKDIILMLEAKNVEDLLRVLKTRGVSEDVQYIYAHEFAEDGTAKEVLAYEAPDEEQFKQPTLLDKLTNRTNKPRIKVKKRTYMEPPLSGVSYKQGMYTGYELSCLT